MTEDVRGLLSKLNAEERNREEADRQLSDLKKEIAAAPTKPEPEPEPEQKSATARKLPDVDDLLNRLRAKMKADRKKSTAGRADIEALVEILKES